MFSAELITVAYLASSKEYFFHRNSLGPSLDFDRLVGGERVMFEIEASPKAPAPSRCAQPDATG